MVPTSVSAFSGIGSISNLFLHLQHLSNNVYLPLFKEPLLV